MPRALSASAMRGSSEAGNGASTAGRAGKCREAVMHRPVEAEINRSSRISPSIAATVSWNGETTRHLGARSHLDGPRPGLLLGRLQRREHRKPPGAGADLAVPLDNPG